MYPVSVFVFLHWIDLYRFGFDLPASTRGSNNPNATFRSVVEWLCDLIVSLVSRFAFFCFADFYTLDLDHYRFDLDPAASLCRSIGLQATLWGVSMWLRCSGTYPVSPFDFYCLADVYRLEFDSSMLTAACNKSVRTFCMSGGWPG